MFSSLFDVPFGFGLIFDLAMPDPLSNPTPLCPADALAIDALVASGFDAGRAAAGADPDTQRRITRIAGLLAALEPAPGAVTPADARLLVDVTMARALREGARRDDAGASLSPDDAAAVDALLAARWDPEETPARHAPRARKIASALTGLDDPALAPRSATAKAALVEATLARVQRETDRARALRSLDPAALSSGARGHRFRLADVISIAAMLVLTFGVIFPTADRLRQDARLQACAANLQNAGIGFATYANDHQGRLPMHAAGFAGAPGSSGAGGAGGGSGAWWNVGDERSHSANLFTLVREKYVRLIDLTCPGNSAANPDLDVEHHTDWRNPDEVSYSYQLPPPSPLVWSGRIRMIVLTDRSPVIDRARRGEAIDPFARSVMHKGRGQNVLVTDGSARLLVSPILPNGDNIWLPRSQESQARPTLKGVERPAAQDDAFVGP